MSTIKLGAEARLEKVGDKLVKDRIKKSYRVPEIDEKLRRQRTRREVNLIDRARRAGVNVPNVFSVEKTRFEMEFLKGELIDEVISLPLAQKLGKAIRKLHDANIIHGDLTTSNLIVKEGEIYFIDFGLGEVSNSVEKKGVDIRVLKEAIRANHSEKADELNNAILKAYGDKEVLARLETIEKRGRYK